MLYRVKYLGYCGQGILDFFQAWELSQRPSRVGQSDECLGSSGLLC